MRAPPGATHSPWSSAGHGPLRWVWPKMTCAAGGSRRPTPSPIASRPARRRATPAVADEHAPVAAGGARDQVAALPGRGLGDRVEERIDRGERALVGLDR